MIELPEAATIARQITETLKGKRIESAMRGNAPHKFAFYNRPPEEYAAILPGKVVGDAWAHGACLLMAVEPDHAIELGGGGERIRFHTDESTLPAKHQLLLRFCDGTYLTVTVQGWGSAQLWGPDERAKRRTPSKPPPLTDAFTLDYFLGLFGELRTDDPASVKYFAISKPGIWGVGNGYLQDILFRAGLHPRRRARLTGEAERVAFYEAARDVVREAAAANGRDTEFDLFGQPGGYRVLLDRRAKWDPCPNCGTPIEAISYLGGRSYFCPTCQR